MRTHITRALSLIVVAVLMFALAGCGCSKDKKEEATNPIPAPAQQDAVASTPEPEVVKEAPGDNYINSISVTDRVAAAAVAEKYIADKTKNKLENLVLNPESKFWAFPEDLNEFNQPGLIIVFDAHVAENKDQPYRIVLIRSSVDSDKWTVKRFGPDNTVVTDKKDSSKESDSKSSDAKKSETKKSDSKSSQSKKSSSKKNN